VSPPLSRDGDDALVASTGPLRRAVAAKLSASMTRTLAGWTSWALDAALSGVHGWLLSDDVVAVVTSALDRAEGENESVTNTQRAGYVVAALARCLARR